MTDKDSYVDMWHIMEALQTKYLLTQNMISTILKVDNSNFSSTTYHQKKNLRDTVRDFLEKGADADGMPGASMLRPLHAAAKMGKTDTIIVLIDAGADVNTVDAFNDRSPLHYAAEVSAHSVLALLERGAKADVQDGDGNTPLHWASYKNKPEAVKHLLQHKASVNATNFNQDTPLSFAAMRGSCECIRLLLEHGADVTARNATGKTPLIRTAITQYGDMPSYEDDVSFDLLLKASGRLILKHSPHYEENNVLNSDRDLYNFLVSLSAQVSPLSALCRAVIRQQFVNRYLPDGVQSLRLPKEIERFLLLLGKR